MTTKKFKIALIEDDLAIVQMYRVKFENEGYDVAVAGDGEAGLALIDSQRPDIILLDLMMPNMNGLEVLKALKDSGLRDKTKVVVLTNVGDSEAATDAYDFGADDYIIKADLTPKEVADRIKQLLTGDPRVLA